MASAKLARAAQETLARNRQEAVRLSQGAGLKRTRELLQKAAKDLEDRIAEMPPAMDDTFTLARLKATLAKVRQTTRELVPGIRDTILDGGEEAATKAAEHTASYLAELDEAFRGVGQEPLALREAAMMERATEGVRSSILMRLASSGEPIEGADEEPDPAKLGILERYGVETIGEFEDIMQKGLIAGKSWSEMQDEITDASPFLQGAPAHWAARIVRTEVHCAYNKASWESIREADEQLGDMLKILSATFDDRTGADSVSTHGQIRLPDEPFDTWYGPRIHPPDRPNDRDIVVPHRASWPIPEDLQPHDEGEILEAWERAGRKGSPPPRPPLISGAAEKLLAEGGGSAPALPE